MHTVLDAIRQIRGIQEQGKDVVMIATNVANAFPSLRPRMTMERIIETVGKDDT